MKTLQIKEGRWYAIPASDGTISYFHALPGSTAREIAEEIDADNPPLVTEVIGTGLRLYDVVELDGEDWAVYDSNADALRAAALRIHETAP
ncbi:hypothetical protein [Sphingomonas sp. 3-13AW]|uniref:hypothetical protein n=1 Tax=Sphingomonas sp. 3-13AW TaxID=3050450 RepID=UPI003BB50C8E